MANPPRPRPPIIREATLCHPLHQISHLPIKFSDPIVQLAHSTLVTHRQLPRQQQWYYHHSLHRPPTAPSSPAVLALPHSLLCPALYQARRQRYKPPSLRQRPLGSKACIRMLPQIKTRDVMPSLAFRPLVSRRPAAGACVLCVIGMICEKHMWERDHHGQMTQK
jgi:hypothetical protein